MAQHRNVIRRTLSGSARVRLCRARELLRGTDEPLLSIEAVAREASMSTFHFIRTFSALFGTTPHQYRIESRLQRARHLLVLGDRSVTEVCLDVGFESPATFSGLFARRVGVAPSEYRRHMRAQIAVPSVLPHVLAPGCFSLMCGAAGMAIFDKHSAGIAAHWRRPAGRPEAVRDV
jgi:AraC-like DNA-binding protein